MNKLKKILALLMVAAFALMSVAFANDTENEENRVQPRSSEYFRSYSGSIVAKGNGRFDIAFCNANRKKRTIPEMPEYYAAKGCTEKVLDETIE